MKQEKVLYFLRTIERCLSFMSEDEFNQNVKDGIFTAGFDQFCWSDKSKTRIMITMQKIPVDIEQC